MCISHNYERRGAGHTYVGDHKYSPLFFRKILISDILNRRASTLLLLLPYFVFPLETVQAYSNEDLCLLGQSSIFPRVNLVLLFKPRVSLRIRSLRGDCRWSTLAAEHFLCEVTVVVVKLDFDRWSYGQSKDCLATRKNKVPFRMATRNGELTLDCFHKTLAHWNSVNEIR